MVPAYQQNSDMQIIIQVSCNCKLKKEIHASIIINL